MEMNQWWTDEIRIYRCWNLDLLEKPHLQEPNFYSFSERKHKHPTFESRASLVRWMSKMFGVVDWIDHYKILSRWEMRTDRRGYDPTSDSKELWHSRGNQMSPNHISWKRDWFRMESSRMSEGLIFRRSCWIASQTWWRRWAKMVSWPWF